MGCFLCQTHLNNKRGGKKAEKSRDLWQTMTRPRRREEPREPDSGQLAITKPGNRNKGLGVLLQDLTRLQTLQGQTNKTHFQTFSYLLVYK